MNFGSMNESKSLRDSVFKTQHKDQTFVLMYESRRLIDAMKYSNFNGGTTTMDTGDHYISDNTRRALDDHPSGNDKRKRMENKLRDYTKLLLSLGVILSAQGSVLLDNEEALDAL